MKERVYCHMGRSSGTRRQGGPGSRVWVLAEKGGWQTTPPSLVQLLQLCWVLVTHPGSGSQSAIPVTKSWVKRCPMKCPRVGWRSGTLKSHCCLSF